MLDERTGTLLSAINERCGGESYQIIEEKELLALFPHGEGADRARVRAALTLLAEERYVEVRYADEGVYCVRTLPEGRRYFEEAHRSRLARRARRRAAFWFSALGGLAGSFAGAALFWALSLLF